jgi:Gpi18-like mannosyltransferase
LFAINSFRAAQNMIDPANPFDTASRVASKGSATDVWLAALTYWYLTGPLSALGFSLGFSLVVPGTVADKDDWLDAFTWMDGRWYNQIAIGGYEYNADKNTNIAFSPVYPLLGRAVMRVTGLRSEVALLIVSNLSLLAGLVILGIYVRERYPGAPTDLACYAVLAAALFPTGCFFRLAYSESTFLLQAVLAMYSMLRRWPLWGIGLLVGLATAARPVGVVLLVPFAIHIVRRSLSSSRRRGGDGANLTNAPTSQGGNRGRGDAGWSTVEGTRVNAPPH